MSDTKASHHLSSSSIVLHKLCALRMSSIGIVSRLLTLADLQEYLSTKSFLDQADLSDSKVEERPDGTEYAAYA